jgi:glutamate carboxypeptidase
MACEIVSQQELGNHLLVRSPAWRKASPQALLVGHMDTVFPADTTFNWYREDDKRSYGPGVIDMKGGLVAGIYALKALHAAGPLDHLPLTFLFNADEEIGSPSSRALIAAEAAHSLFAFVLECGGQDGEVVTGRKGNLSLRLDISGKAGHAAFAGQDKASAIMALAHKIIALENLHQPQKALSANVGLIGGGIGPNTVADKAWARVDFRFETASDFDGLWQAINAIVDREQIPGTHATASVVSSRPPMPTCTANQELFAILQQTASRLGQTVHAEFRHGVSDANLLAAQNVPVLDGLGPLGAKDHSEDEYLLKESLPARACLVAAALVDSWQHFKP